MLKGSYIVEASLYYNVAILVLPLNALIINYLIKKEFLVFTGVGNASTDGDTSIVDSGMVIHREMVTYELVIYRQMVIHRRSGLKLKGVAIGGLQWRKSWWALLLILIFRELKEVVKF